MLLELLTTLFFINIGINFPHIISNIKLAKYPCILLHVISPVINAQRLSFSSLQAGTVFPGPGVTLPSFIKPDSLPRIHLPQSFLFAARGIEMPNGKLSSEVGFVQHRP